MSITTPTSNIDQALVAEAAVVRHRAESLRQRSAGLDEMLSLSYRRRASELEMEAWLLEVRAGLPATEIHAAA